MSTAKDAKIRGHRLALANALRRGDQKSAKEQRSALRAMGASVPRGGSGGSTRKTGGMKKNPYGGRVRVVSGYRRNPEGDDPLFDAAVKLREQEEAAEKAAEEAKEAARRAEQAAKEAEKSGSAAAEKRADAAEKKAAQAEKKAEKAEAKAEQAKEQLAEKAEKKPRKKPAKKGEAGSKKTMAKPTKEEYQKRARKAARTRKRNAAAKAGGKAAGKAPSKSAGRKGKRSKESYQAAAKKAAATRRRNARAAGKAPAAKAGGRKGKSKNRVYGLPKGFKRVDERTVTRAKKGREVRTIVRYRRFKDNPLSDMGKIAMLGGGVVVGLVLSDMLRRYVATMAPKGGKEPFYGTPAAERVSVAPDAMQLGAQALLGVVAGGAAYAWRKKSPGATTFFAGVAIGSIGLALLEGINFFLMPKILPAANISEKKLGNRLYVFEQKYGQEYIKADITKQNEAIAAGKTVNPDGGTIAGFRGVGALPPAQQTRALPPPARANAVGQPAAQNNSVGAPADQNSVGCGGYGCGGGCTGGRNCGCAKCRGFMPSNEALVPPGQSYGASGGDGGYGRSGASNGGTPARGSTPARGNIAGPRQLGSAPPSLGFMPSRSAPRVAFSR